jgi:adenylate cyclase
MSFFDELKQRKVIRSAIVYGVVAWAIIQVADTVFPRLGLPDWTVTFIIVVAALGFPIALVVAWFYDSKSAAPRAAGLVGFGIVVGLAVFGAYKESRPEPEGPSVAVLPFADMSPQKDQEYLGDGITEEILNGLAQLPDLRVPARTSLVQGQKPAGQRNRETAARVQHRGRISAQGR